MQPVTFPRVVGAAAVAVAAAAGLVLVARTPQVELPAASESPDPPTAETSPSQENGEPLVAAAEPPAAARLRELTEMSETFRNTTFLTAIRDSGFICRELLQVYGGVNNSTTWTASCSEMLAYTVTVVNSGRLHIEPLLQHLDAVPRVPQEPRRELVPSPQRR